MLFPTIEFAVFFAVVFPITWLLNAYNTWKKLFLVAASYYFYAYWRVDFTLLLFASSLGNYLAALVLGRLDDGVPRRAVLWIAVAANIGLLGYFKYYNFFVASLINAAHHVRDQSFDRLHRSGAADRNFVRHLSRALLHHRRLPAHHQADDVAARYSVLHQLLSAPDRRSDRACQQIPGADRRTA